MIILLYGPDIFRSNKKLKEIIKNYQTKHKSGLNLAQFEWSGDILGRLDDILSSYSMFDEKKLVIIKNACAVLKNSQEELIGLLGNKRPEKDDNMVLVFWESETLKQNELFEWLVKKAKMSECFERLTGTKLNNWVKKEIENLGGKTDSRAVEKLVAYVGPDLWQMANEVNKLVSYKVGKLITEVDVDLLVKSKYDPNIFATIDALANRNKNLAYKLMHEHLAQGENEIYILTMFVYQFRNLLQIKSLIDGGLSSDEVIKKTGLHPFVIKKSWSMLKNFSLEVLKKIYERLLQLDIAIKRGKIEPETALDLIVAEISG